MSEFGYLMILYSYHCSIYSAVHLIQHSVINFENIILVACHACRFFVDIPPFKLTAII